MALQIQNEVQQSLVQELNLVMRYYFHQTLDEILAELRFQSNYFTYTSNPESILKTIYQSGVLFQRSDKIVSQIRDAISRFVHGTYGVCKYCGGAIPSIELKENPTMDACNRCVQDRYLTVFKKELFH